MKSLLGLLRFAKRYKPFVISNVLCNILMVLFSLVSVTAIIPFLQILFDIKKPVRAPEATDVPIQAANFLGKLDIFMSDLIETHGKHNALLWVIGGVILLFFLKNLFRYLALAFMAPVRNGIIRDLRTELFGKMLNLHIGYFSEERKGDLMARMTYDVQEVEWSVLNVLEIAVREPLMMIGTLILMFIFSAKLTIFVFVLLGITAVVIGGIGRKLRQKSTYAQEKLGSLLSVIDEALGGLRIVHSFGAEGYQASKFGKINDDYRWLSIRLLWRRDLASPLSEFMGVSIMMALLWFGSHLVFKSEMGGEQFIAYIGLFYGVLNPAKNFATAFYSIQKGLGAANRIEAILQAESEIQDKPDAVEIKTFEKGIEFRDIHFNYRTGEPVLKKINIEVPKGKMVALVGASGAGKSTLADLIPRFYDVQEGAILIDGHDIKDITTKSLRSLIGIVSQEPILFNDTIAANISFGINATKEEIETAARIANAHDFIMQQPEGYDTNIGDRGCKLSGGQRQRLTIARAVLKNPPILILDEATSALDSESEKLVQDALSNIMKGHTSIVVAHRLSTIQSADEIIVLNEGEIVERGTHEELIAKNATYKRLIELQGF